MQFLSKFDNKTAWFQVRRNFCIHTPVYIRIFKEFWIFYSYVYMQRGRMKKYSITGLETNRKSVSLEAELKFKGAC